MRLVVVGVMTTTALYLIARTALPWFARTRVRLSRRWKRRHPGRRRLVARARSSPPLIGSGSARNADNPQIHVALYTGVPRSFSADRWVISLRDSEVTILRISRGIYTRPSKQQMEISPAVASSA